jgi:hypothetical protein
LFEDTRQRTHHDKERPLGAPSDIGLSALPQKEQQRQQRAARQQHLQHEIRTRFLSNSPQYTKPADHDLRGSLLLAFD